jgi:mono/diheme cytochrome c family protein
MHFRCSQGAVLVLISMLANAWLLTALAADAPTPAEVSTAGEQLFAAQCVRCHGEHGMGTENYPDPLFGTLSIQQLAEQIHKTMPEDDPGTLSSEQAAAVATYIHEAFYSPIAQQRNEPVRIALARLTVNQYRRAIANVVDGYQPRTDWQPGGLQGEYFDGREPGPEDKRVLVRTDAGVDFDFGTTLPLPELKDPFAYSMIWSGSVYAPDTGWYEFGVTTEHAVQLWVNHQQEPLVDAWVKSGNDTEHRGRIYLLGGQVYPLRLRFSRGNQGVTDEKVHAEHQTEAAASIRLSWRPPQGAWRTIPARCLSPQSERASFVCTTPFPPDDRSYGWERATSISQAWFDATTDAAIETADFIGARLSELAGTSNADPARTTKLQQYCGQVAERAFRGPLTEAARVKYIDQHFAGEQDAEVAVRRSLLMILKSPRFLFREVDDSASFDTAARLAFALTDAPADEPLQAAARAGELTTPEQLRAQAERLLAEPRTKWKLRQFLLAWLQLDGEVDLHKDSAKYPNFDEQTIADLRESLDLFLDDVVWSEGSDYRKLFLTDEVFVNSRLAQFYGEQEVPANGFAKERLDEGRRAGVITHPYVLAKYAHADVTSPIHRGVFLVRKVLGQALKPPPVAIAPVAVSLHPDLTTRERVTLQTEAPACMTCHHLINPLGFSLERFDAVGRYRETEHNKQIDDRAAYQPREGEQVSFTGARELAEFFAESPEVRSAFVQQMFQFLVQQSLQAYGPELAQELDSGFVASNYNIRELAVEMAARIAPIGRPASGNDPKVTP